MKKNQMLISIGAIAVLAIFYYFSAGGRTVQKSVNDESMAADSTSVFSFSVVNEVDTFRFVRESNGWLLDGYTVNNSSFEKIFSDLSRIKLDRFVSKNIAKYEKYGVDSTATRVLMYDESGALLSDYHIGNVSSTGNETFVRETGEKKVYAILENYNSYSSFKQSDYWKKEIVELDPENIFSISVEGDFKYLLEQKNLGWTFDGQLTDEKKGTDLARKIVIQRASKVSKEEIPSMAMLLTTITITPRNGKPLTLKYFENEEVSTSVYVQVVGNPMRFEFYKSTFDSFNKKFDGLKPEEPAPAEMGNN